MKKCRDRIDEFNLAQGRIIAGKHEVIEKLGDGYESEVYKIQEVTTGIIRAAKLFFYKEI